MRFSSDDNFHFNELKFLIYKLKFCVFLLGLKNIVYFVVTRECSFNESIGFRVVVSLHVVSSCRNLMLFFNKM